MTSRANMPWNYKASLSTGVYGLYNFGFLQKSVEPPQFTKFQWGIIEINHGGKRHIFKDCIITPNNAVEWNWKLDGTRHNPGITINAIESNKLLDNVDVVILSKGVNNKLKTKRDTQKYLKKAKKEGKIKDYHILQSNKAVQKYKALIADGQKVSGLFHSTC